MTGRNWVRQFRAAAAVFDWQAVSDLSSEYAARLYAVPVLPDSVGPVLMILRQALRYEELEVVADAALAHEDAGPAVRRQYAQALVDGRNPAVALRLYAELAADDTVPMAERLEAEGGIGRCYKELYLACTEPADGASTSRGHWMRISPPIARTRTVPGTASTRWPSWRAPGATASKPCPNQNRWPSWPKPF